MMQCSMCGLGSDTQGEMLPTFVCCSCAEEGEDLRDVLKTAFVIGCINRGIGMTRSAVVLKEITKCATEDARLAVAAWKTSGL